MIKINELAAGSSYACRFKIEHDGDVYESIGLLLTRDTEQSLVKLRDIETLMEFVVPFDNIWDIDYVNWTEAEEKP
jgi:hypothetical protein